VLQLKGVSKSYDRGKTWAVDNLNLEINSGEIFGFLGPNGAGKTTTLRTIVGLLPPDRGTIVFDGIDVWKKPLVAKRRISFLPDNPNIYDRLTGLEYVRFIADVYGVPAKERRERLERLLHIFDMAAAAPDLIKSYSHGMRQKIALIAALIPQPDLLVLDEPITGLDPRSVHLFKNLLHEHCRAGGTVFFSTHILDVAERLCDRVGIIRKGRLIACGTMEQLRRDRMADTTLETLFLELTESEAETTETETEAEAGKREREKERRREDK